MSNHIAMSIRPHLLGLYILFILSTLTAKATDGDTIRIRAHDSRDIGWWGAYDDWGVFPSGDDSYRKVLLHFTMGCASSGCSDWDYTVQIDLRHRTGMLDSTSQVAPNFTVNGAEAESLSYTTEHTFTTSWNGASVDTLWSDTLTIVLFDDPDDPFAPTSTIVAFAADVAYDLFDNEGNVTGTQGFEAEGTLELELTEVFTVFEVIDNIELGRAITPYGGYMANGQQGFNNNWTHVFTYDVTAYQHLLRDSVQFRAFYGGWSSGFSVTLDFDLIEGTPPMDVVKVSRIYDSGPGGFNYPNSATFEANSTPPKSVELHGDTEGALCRMFVTGHGQAGEFTPGIHYFLRVNGTEVGSRHIWKGDCGMNAIYPQGGTWIYDRANWCPGEAVPIYDHDITQQLNTGGTNTLDIDLTQFTPSAAASYIMELQLIEHRGPNFQLDAEIVDVAAPSLKDIHRRFNPICGSPRIRIRNGGAQLLTSVTVTYGLEGGAQQTHEWNGSLAFMEETEIDLPPIADWSGGHRVFTAMLSAPNGGVDEQPANDSYRSPFAAPDAVLATDAIIINVRSNNFGHHNAYRLTDAEGNVIFERPSLQSNTTYNDTLHLPVGCYRFHLTDAEHNGLSWWAAPNQGSGYARIRRLGHPGLFKTFTPDFGSEISYWFTMGGPLSSGQMPAARLLDMKVYPNPLTLGHEVQVEVALGNRGNVLIELTDLAGRTVLSRQFKDVTGVNDRILLGTSGVYLLRALTAEGVRTERVIVQ